MQNSDTKTNALYLLVIVTFLIKVSLVTFAQTVNPDVVSRVFYAIEWMKNPHWIRTSVWGPLHYYIIAFSLYIWDNYILMPKLVNIIFSSLSLIPFYFFTKREFNAKGAFYATIFFTTSPILFRNSFLALSETPYLFFLVLSMNFLSRGIRKKSIWDICIAGLAISVASGLRYEAWLIIGIFGFLLLLTKEWKLIGTFAISSAIFPITWLISNWVETGDPLYGIQGNYHWTLEVMGNNDDVNFESYLRRIWFFPFSWIIAVGIPVAYVILKKTHEVYTKKPIHLLHIALTIPFIVMFLFMQYNAFKGVLLLQHRFICTLVAFSLPFAALYFDNFSKKRIRQAIIFVLLTIGLSFVYNTSDIKPIPRLKDQSGAKIAKIVKDNISKESFLIIDFIGWENSYFIAENSMVPPENILIVEGARNSVVPLETIKQIITEKESIVLLKRNSVLFYELDILNFVTYKPIVIQELFAEKDILVLHLKMKS